MIADLESVEKQIAASRKVKSGDKDAKVQDTVLNAVKALLDDGKPARAFTPGNDDEAKALKTLGLLTVKPMLYVCNAPRMRPPPATLTAKVEAFAAEQGSSAVIISPLLKPK